MLTRITFLKRKSTKQRLWKTLTSIVGVSTVMNLTMVGVFAAPQQAKAAVGTLTLDSISHVSSNTYKASGVWAPQGNQCFTPGSGFHYKVYVYDDLNGNGAYDAGEKLTEVSPAACNGDFTAPVASADRDQGGNWPAAGQPAASFALAPGSHSICAVLIHVSPNGNDIAEANYCYGQNQEKALVSGYKFKDTNGNAAWDGGEPGLSNWQINLTGQGSVNTGGTGYFEFTNVDIGARTLSETQKPNWVQTAPPAPGTFSLNIDYGDIIVDNFGNKPGLCNLQVTKTVDQTNASPGDVLTYTITYNNTGSGFCTGGGVELFDQFNTDGGAGHGLTFENNPGDATIVVNNDQDLDPSDPVPQLYPNTFTGGSDKHLGNLHEIGPGENGVITLKAKVQNPQTPCQVWDVWNSGRTDGTEPESDVQFASPHTTVTSGGCAGSLKVTKVVQSGSADPDEFGFRLGGSGGYTNPTTGTDYVIFSNLTPGPYTVDETGPANYHQVSTTCTNVPVASNQQATCTITNAHDTGDLTVVKKLDADGNGSFETINPGGWTWSIDGSGTYAFGSSQTRQTAQAYAINENFTGPYHFVGWYTTGSTQYSCTNPEGASLPVSWTPVAGQPQSITLCNAHDTGTVTFEKTFTSGNGDPADWTFTIDGWSGGPYNSGDSETLPTGDYTVTEHGPAGYVSASVSGICSNLQNSDATMTVTKAGGTCTFTNTRQAGDLRVIKWVDTDGDGIYDTQNPGSGSWSIDGSGTYAFGTAESVVTGNHDVDEVFPGPYHFTGGYFTAPVTAQTTVAIPQYSCTNPQFTTLPATVNVSTTGATVVLCNARDTGRISGLKFNDLNGNGTMQAGEEWQPWYPSITISLDNGAKTTTTAADGSYSFANVPTGDHTVSEVVPSGWFNTTPQSINFNLTVNGQDNLNFGNRHVAYVRVIKNVDENGDGDLNDVGDVNGATNWTWDLNNGNQNFSTGFNFQEAVPGTTTVSEDQKPGYHVTSSFCSPIEQEVDSALTSVNALAVSTPSTTQTFQTSEWGQYQCEFTNTKDVLTIGIAKTGPATAAAGTQITYTMTWSTNGNSPVTGAVLTDVIPTNTTFVSQTCGTTIGTCTMSFASNTAKWELGNRNPGESGTVTMTVLLGSPLTNGTTILNTVAFDTNETDPKTAQASTVVASTPNLQITKSNNINGFVNPGQGVIYTVTVTNASGSTDTAKNVVITDTLPNGFVFADTGLATKTIAVGDLTPGQSKTFTYNVNVSQFQLAGFYTNTANAKGDNTTTVTATSVVEVRVPTVLGETSEPSLIISKVVKPTVSKPGAVVTYTVAVKNIGDDDATNVTIVDTLPDGFTFVDTGTKTRTFALGTIEPSHTRTLNYDVRIGNSVKAGTYANRAVLTADGLEQQEVQATITVKVPKVLGLATTGPSLKDYLIFMAGLMLAAAGAALALRARRHGAVQA